MDVLEVGTIRSLRTINRRFDAAELDYTMQDNYDVVIAGGGPAGATAALVLARSGLSVCVLEKDTHPRFHIGESLLPRTTPLLRELGIEARISALPQVTKNGAEFGFGDAEVTRKFTFNDALIKGSAIFNVERAVFDKALLDLAREAGAEVFENTPVRDITHLDETDRDANVEVRTDSGLVRGRLLLDATGQGTLVGRKLKHRRGFADPQLQKVAYFQHYEGVQRLSGDEAGHPCIVLCDEGWFWLIPINDQVTSVGFVTRPSFVRTLQVPPTAMLGWAIARCPLVRQRLHQATGSAHNQVAADFSYRCQPYAGPGYFLLGDAACFLDPIFSTGVTLAMMSGKHVADLVLRMFAGQLSARTARRQYIAFIERSTQPFWRLINNSYRHSFRELFVSGGGPMQIPGAIISVLAGQVFPRPPWALRWRQRMFEALVWAQQYVALAPRRAPFSLLAQAPAPLEYLLSANVGVEAQTSPDYRNAPATALAD